MKERIQDKGESDKMTTKSRAAEALIATYFIGYLGEYVVPRHVLCRGFGSEVARVLLGREQYGDLRRDSHAIEFGTIDTAYYITTTPLIVIDRSDCIKIGCS